VAAAASPGGSSTLRPWGSGLPTAETAATRPAPPGPPGWSSSPARSTSPSSTSAPGGDSPGDTIVFTDDRFDQAGRRIGRDQAHCTIMFRGDVLCDASFVIAGRGQLLLHGVGLTFAVTGGTGEFRKARGQMHETFLPTGEFRFAFTLYL
jgi:hypothetical protein